MFFVSGAESTDRDSRIEGVSWWSNEQLNYREAEACLAAWENSTCSILASHDCPQSISKAYCRVYDRTLTRNLLQRMVEVRKPALCVFGHHHRPLDVVHDGVRYKCLAIEEAWSPTGASFHLPKTNTGIIPVHLGG